MIFDCNLFFYPYLCSDVKELYISMSKDNHNTGIVYVLSNRAMPGLVKIGMTTRHELDARLKELYTTGVPVPFDVE